MNIIGIKFKNNEVYVPDVLVRRAMKAGTEIIKPQLIASGGAVKVICISVEFGWHDDGRQRHRSH